MATTTPRQRPRPAPSQTRATSGEAPPGRVLPTAALAAATAAGGVLTALLVVTVLAWALAPGTAGAAAPARVAAWAWLAALRVPLEVRVPGGSFELGLAPLGLTVACGAALWQAGRWTARRAAVTSVPGAVEAALALGASYAACAGLAAGLSDGAARPEPLAALLLGWLVGALIGGAGVAEGAGLLRPALARLPVDVREALRATLASALALLAAGALVVAVSLLAHAARVGALTVPGGGLALLVAGAAYAPTAAVWGAAYALGPGFAVGAGTVAGPFGAHLGAVPALPLLGALPADSTGASAGAWSLLLPVAACAVGGWLLGRRLGLAPATAAVRALSLAPALAVVGVLAAVAAGGPAGPGRLAVTGPSPWQTGLALGVVALLAAPTAAYEASRRATGKESGRSGRK